MVVHAGLIGRTRRLAVAAGVLSVIGLVAAPQSAQAGGISTGAAVGLGLGAFALGTAVGASAAPYYAPPAYAYYPPSPAYYYPPAPAYYAPYGPRSCWNPYYGRYYPC
jgi:hypothetical protein